MPQDDVQGILQCGHWISTVGETAGVPRVVVTLVEDGIAGEPAHARIPGRIDGPLPAQRGSQNVLAPPCPQATRAGMAAPGDATHAMGADPATLRVIGDLRGPAEHPYAPGIQLTEAFALDGRVVLANASLALAGDPLGVSRLLRPCLHGERHVLLEMTGLGQPQVGALLRRRIVELAEGRAVSLLYMQDQSPGGGDDSRRLVDHRSEVGRGVDVLSHELLLSSARISPAAAPARGRQEN